MYADIIAVGSELLTPSRLETNSLFITRKLNQCGIRVRLKTVVGDREEDLRHAFRGALREAEIVITTGGLGPTHDDITREVVSDTLGRRLSLEPAIVEKLRARYRGTGLKLTANNRRQAMVPEGATVIDNPNGTAPGLFLRQGEALIFLLPGPPRELKPMMTDSVIPLIRQNKKTSRQFYRQLKVASAAESRVDALIGSIYKSYPDIETTILGSPGRIDLLFYWTGEPEEAQAEAQLKELSRKVRQKLGKLVFTDREEELEEVVGRLLRERGLTLATAESCTGGLLGKLLTDVPGSSDYYLGGVVSYSNRLKSDWLGVNEVTLERFGAVSDPVARQMARGICRRTGADLGLSITGVAGPAGGTADKPRGLVFIGLADCRDVQVRRLQFPGSRETVRLRTARQALDLVRTSLSMTRRTRQPV